MKKTKKKLGELLLDAGLIDEIQLRTALSYQDEWGGRLGSIITKKGFVSEGEMLSVIEKQYGLTSVHINDISRPDDEVLHMVKVDDAKKYGFFPLGIEGKTMKIVIADPTDLKTLDDISFKLGLRVKPYLALESDIIKAIEKHYEGKHTAYKERPIQVSQSMHLHDGDQLDVDMFQRPVELEKYETNIILTDPLLSDKALISVVIDLLVAKGIITKEELASRLKSLQRSSP